MRKIILLFSLFVTCCFYSNVSVAQTYDECAIAGPSNPATEPAAATNPAYPAVQVVCLDGSFPECSTPADAAGAADFAGDCGSANYDFVITNPQDVVTGDGGAAVLGVSPDGVIDPTALGFAVGESVCMTGFCYDLNQIIDLVVEINANGSACSAAESLAGAPVCPIPVPTSLADLFALAGSIGGGGAVSVGDVVALLPQLDALSNLGVTNVPVCALLTGGDTAAGANQADYCMEVVDCAAEGSPCGACAIMDMLAAAPAAPTVTESVCAADGVTLEGGVVDAITCPVGSTAEYSIDGGVTWATTVPVYDQTTAITVTVRCLCDEDMTTASPIAEVTTVPGVCVVVDIVFDLTDPCNCVLGIDTDLDPSNGNELASETITITAGTAPFQITDATGLVDSAGNPLVGDDGVNPISATNPLTLAGNTLVAFVPADGAATYMLTGLGADGGTGSIMGGPCAPCPIDPPVECGITAGEPTPTTATVCNTELSSVDVTAVFTDAGPAGTASLAQNYAVTDPATGDLITISNTATLDLSSLAVGDMACVQAVAYTQETLDAITGAVDGVTQFPGSPVPAFGMLDLSGFLNGLNGVFEAVGVQFTAADIQGWCETQTLTIPFSALPGGLIPDLVLDLMTLIPPSGFCCDFSDSDYCLTVENCLEPCDADCANELFVQIESIEVIDPDAVVGGLFSGGCAGAATLDGINSEIEVDIVINGTMLAQIPVDGGTAGVTPGPFGGFNSAGITACGGIFVDAPVSISDDDSAVTGGSDDLTDNPIQQFDLAGGTFTACGGGIVITYSVMCGPADCAAMCADCEACDVVVCDPLVSTTTAPVAVVTAESTCEADGTTLSGGLIDPPAAACPAGSTLEYSIDAGTTWSTTLPTYDQTTAVTADTRCICDSDATDISTVASVTTVPGSCTVEPCAADAPTMSIDCAACADGTFGSPCTVTDAGDGSANTGEITEYLVIDDAAGTATTTPDGVISVGALADAQAAVDGLADGATVCVTAITHIQTELDVVIGEIEAAIAALGLTLGLPPTGNTLAAVYAAIQTLAGGATVDLATIETLIANGAGGMVDLGAALGLPAGLLVVDLSPFCYNVDPAVCVTAATCAAGALGCTDMCAPNYDPAAETDDGSCEAYDMTCNADCTAGPFGGTWDAATCACINEEAQVLGCTDPAADNYNAAANCDDGSCMTGSTCDLTVGVSTYVCNDGGTMSDGTDDNADVSFVIMTSAASFTVTNILPGTGAATGNFVDFTGVAAGTTITFTVTDADDCVVDYSYIVLDCTLQIPTLSQWGLISLALLLMVMGSLKMGFSTITYQSVRKK